MRNIKHVYTCMRNNYYVCMCMHTPLVYIDVLYSLASQTHLGYIGGPGWLTSLSMYVIYLCLCTCVCTCKFRKQ